MQSPKAYLVESIPLGMEDLRGTAGVEYTENVLKRLADGTETTIDITAMYWNLLPDGSRADESGFSDAQFAAFGAGHGSDLYDALKRAAQRGVRIRILESPGFEKTRSESDTLAQEFPEQVQIHQINMEDWYGAGIMHQKIWIFDRGSIYIGSANMDWKSISQVKELGLVTEDTPQIAEEVSKYFDTWWLFSALKPCSLKEQFDPQSQITRTVPAWSPLVPAGRRLDSPLDKPELQTPYDRAHPLSVSLNGEQAGVFITGCPTEICVPHRTYDGDGIVYTILDAEMTICISVMDFAPVSLFRGTLEEESHRYVIDGKTATPVWWPALFDALLHAVTTKGVHARLLISKWAHSSPFIVPYLHALAKAAKAGQANPLLTSGHLEIKLFVIPGWDSTTEPDRKYPGHTRVNHTKYIVTDRRINIGTSNMTWDYFANTAGASFNTDHPGLVPKLQAVFDRDWESRYALPLIVE
jgi:phospholipase D3/4